MIGVGVGLFESALRAQEAEMFTSVVGTPYDGIGLTGEGTWQTLLAAGHAAGRYRISFHAACTTAGTSGSQTFIHYRYNDGIATRNIIATVMNQNGTGGGAVNLTSTANVYTGTASFPSNGSATIEVEVHDGTYNSNPVFNVRGWLEYLGP